MSLFIDFIFFFFNDTATTEIYTLSLHDALPIYDPPGARPDSLRAAFPDILKPARPQADRLVVVPSCTSSHGQTNNRGRDLRRVGVSKAPDDHQDGRNPCGSRSPNALAALREP